MCWITFFLLTQKKPVLEDEPDSEDYESEYVTALPTTADVIKENDNENDKGTDNKDKNRRRRRRRNAEEVIFRHRREPKKDTFTLVSKVNRYLGDN